ncbi:MAG TPA: DUF3341 domain-containing protein [Oscillatoriaceae cyanobacterium]
MPLYGLMAMFDHPDRLLAATRAAYDAGYRQMEAYTPFQIEGLYEALGHRSSLMPRIVLIGGALGALTGYGMQLYSLTADFPLTVAGRAYHSWPSYIPITFELTILFGAFAAFFGMLWINGLPMPYHPVFNAPHFELASRNRFFLCIEARDANFDLERTRRFLLGLHAQEVDNVEA